MAVVTAAALILFPGPLDGPLCTALDLAVASLAAALAWTAMAIVREEERLNGRGETLVPRRWRYDRRAILLGTAEALAEAVEGLESGEDIGDVLGALREGTRRGDGLPEGRGRLCYDIAMDIMREDRVSTWLARHPRFRVSFFPDDGLWLEMVVENLNGIPDEYKRRVTFRLEHILAEIAERGGARISPIICYMQQ